MKIIWLVVWINVTIDLNEGYWNFSIKVYRIQINTLPSKASGIPKSIPFISLLTNSSTLHSISSTNILMDSIESPTTQIIWGRNYENRDQMGCFEVDKTGHYGPVQKQSEYVIVLKGLNMVKRRYCPSFARTKINPQNLLRRFGIKV